MSFITITSRSLSQSFQDQLHTDLPSHPRRLDELAITIQSRAVRCPLQSWDNLDNPAPLMQRPMLPDLPEPFGYAGARVCPKERGLLRTHELVQAKPPPKQDRNAFHEHVLEHGQKSDKQRRGTPNSIHGFKLVSRWASTFSSYWVERICVCDLVRI